MVVRHYFYLLSPYERPELLNGPNQRKALFFRYRVVDFWFTQQPARVREDMLFPIVLLYKDSSYPVVAGVAMYFHRQVVPWVGLNWRRGEDGFQSLEATLVFFPP